MAKLRVANENIEKKIAQNRSSCDYLLHELIDGGLSEEDVAPLRKLIEATQLGKGYMRFMQFAEDLVSCEPKLDQKKIAPIMLETWNGVYELETLHVHRAKLIVDSQRKDEKSDSFAAAVDSLSRCEKQLAKVNIEFNKYRALNHVHLGSYDDTPEAAFEDKEMAVIAACKSSDYGRLSQLMEHKKYSPNEYELSTGASPLHYAAWQKEKECVVKLIESKANVNAKTLRGFTPLHFAYQQHDKEIIDILLKSGADACAKSSLGQAPGAKGEGLGSELEIEKPFY